jgi:hypothetical protein
MMPAAFSLLHTPFHLHIYSYLLHTSQGRKRQNLIPIGLSQYKSKNLIMLSEKIIAGAYHVNGMLRNWFFHLLILSKTIYVLAKHRENFKS